MKSSNKKFSLDNLGHRNNASFFVSPIDEIEVKDIISQLQTWKSVGPFSISVDLLKVTRTTFYEISKISHICSIFRKSVCIRWYTYFETTQVLFSLCFRENGVEALKNE